MFPSLRPLETRQCKSKIGDFITSTGPFRFAKFVVARQVENHKRALDTEPWPNGGRSEETRETGFTGSWKGKANQVPNPIQVDLVFQAVALPEL